MAPPEARPKYSVIIPVGPNDESWTHLLSDLSRVTSDLEILLAATQPASNENLTTIDQCAKKQRTTWLENCSKGRPQQLNAGAKASSGQWLLFLHADSRVSQECFDELSEAIAAAANHLYYFQLRFENRGNALLRLTELGVKIRCQTWGMPYGDQGFAIGRENFSRLGGYPVIQSGEDHAFAWLCKNSGLAPKALNASLTTSSRKYQKLGWTNVAIQHNLLGMKQALRFRRQKAAPAVKCD